MKEIKPPKIEFKKDKRKNINLKLTKTEVAIIKPILKRNKYKLISVK